MLINSLFTYSLLGALAGFLAGLLGVGGGVIIVPGLANAFPAFGMPKEAIMHMAASTSLASVFFTAISAVIIQHRNRAINWSLFQQIAPGIIIGTVMGAIIANHLSTYLLAKCFGGFMFFVAFRILFTKPPAVIHQAELKNITKIGIGCVIGFVSGLIGIGGGAVSIPIFLRLGLTPHQAGATSSACVLLLAFVGVISFTITGWHSTGLPPGSTGYIYWPAVIIIAISSMIAVPFGTKLGKKISGKLLKRLFAIFLLLVACDMLVQ